MVSASEAENFEGVARATGGLTMKRFHHCGDCAHFEACAYTLKRSSKDLKMSRCGYSCEH